LFFEFGTKLFNARAGLRPGVGIVDYDITYPIWSSSFSSINNYFETQDITFGITNEYFARVSFSSFFVEYARGDLRFNTNVDDAQSFYLVYERVSTGASFSF